MLNSFNALLSTYPFHVLMGTSLYDTGNTAATADYEVMLIRETAHCSEWLDHVADLTAVAGQRRAALRYAICLPVKANHSQ